MVGIFSLSIPSWRDPHSKSNITVFLWQILYLKKLYLWMEERQEVYFHLPKTSARDFFFLKGF